MSFAKFTINGTVQKVSSGEKHTWALVEYQEEGMKYPNKLGVTAFGKQARSLAGYKEGSVVTLSGRPENRKKQDGEGYEIRLIVTDVGGSSDADDSDIPF